MKRWAVNIVLALSAILSVSPWTQAFGQSAQSDDLFARGVALYEQQRYREAAVIFASVDSLDRAELDTTGTRHIYGRMWQASCYFHLGDTAKARKLDFYACELPPVDRRLTVRSDSMCALLDSVFKARNYEGHLALTQRIAALEREELGGETLFSLNTLSQAIYPLGFMQRGEEAEAVIDDVISKSVELYGKSNRLIPMFLSSKISLLFFFGNLPKAEAVFRDIIARFAAQGDLESDEAWKIITSWADLCAAAGDLERFDAAKDLIHQYVVKAKGSGSADEASFLINTATISGKLGREELALQQAKEAERIADALGAEGSTLQLSARVTQVSLLIQQNKFDEATRIIKACLKRGKGTEQETIIQAGLLPMLFLTQAMQGKKVNKGMIEDALSVLNRLEAEQGTQNDLYAQNSLFIATLLYLAGDQHKAAAMVTKNMDYYEKSHQFHLLFNACLILLSDGQFVNARKASSRALNQMNQNLSERNVALLVGGCKSNVVSGLKTLDIYQEEHHIYSSDTIAYALGLIRQDLLQARLLIYEHQDSIGTPPFMEALNDYVLTAAVRTKDLVMADSIISRYLPKIAAACGTESDTYAQAQTLKEQGRFAKVEGNYKARKVTYKRLGSKQHSAMLRDFLSEFAKWQKRQAEGTPNKSDTYSPPSLSDLLRKRNFEETLDNCETAFLHYKEQAQSGNYISTHAWSDIMKAWCLCADSLGQQARIVTRLREWLDSAKKMAEEVRRIRLDALAQAWLHCTESDYDALEAEVAATIPDERIDLHAAVMMKVLDNISNYKTAQHHKAVIKKALQASDLALSQIKSQRGDKDLNFAKLFLLRTNLMWNRHFWLDVKRDSLLDDFKTIYVLLQELPALQPYQQSYDAMLMLCSIAADIYPRDDQLTIQADKMRKSVQEACEEKYRENAVKTKTLTLSRLMAKKSRKNPENLKPVYNDWDFLSVGQGFDCSVYDTRYYDIDNQSELTKRIGQAYLRAGAGSGTEKAAESVEKFWDNFRSLQRSSYYSDDEMTEQIEELMSHAADALQTPNDTLSRMAYDIALFGKGYMVRSEQALRRVIAESGNRTALSRFDEYLRLQQQLDDIKLPDSVAYDLRSRAQSIWNELKESSLAFDDYTKSLEASWRDVRNALRKDEAAIEFIQHSIGNFKQYYALVLRHDYDAPLVARAGWESDFLENMDSLYTMTRNLLWPTFAMKGSTGVYPLEGVKTIYVAPTGLLHQLSIENLRNYKGPMSEQYTIHRLTSTRELIGRQQQKGKKREAMLCGGIAYDLDDDTWQMLALAAAERAAAAKAAGQPLTAMRDAPKLSRGVVDAAILPLEGTREEVEQIANALTARDITTYTYTDALATEERVKAVSGSNISILHIATHGFYQTAEAADEADAIKFSRSGDNREQNALSRSGLFMAGAAAVFDKTDIPDLVDDGILTARELSHLDFTGLDLVVLSACETALGDITGDGVFGLQRGFKKAGAHSILMSLWKVDDEATCHLMTEFYRNWTSGLTKHEALERAKQSVRRQPGWSDPKYWAAFILLDGLD